MSSAGWGAPVNKPTPVHWWREDGRKVCEPDDLVGYLGPKLEEDTLPVSRVCFHCFIAVFEARMVLGSIKPMAATSTTSELVEAARCAVATDGAWQRAALTMLSAAIDHFDKVNG